MFIVFVVFYRCFFFFKQKTAYEMRISDWSSDVCSSDLAQDRPAQQQFRGADPEDQLAQLPQAPEGKFQSDRKEKQDDAESAAQRDILGRPDREVLQPRILARRRA